MRFGINSVFPHETPEQWAELLHSKGLSATAFPVNYTASQKVIDAYLRAFQAYDIQIAEVGVWNSPFSSDKATATRNREVCKRQLELADYVHANCCVNVSGSAGDCWYACYEDNYSKELYEQNIDFLKALLDDIRPQNTFYTLEIMQWMVPDSAESYLQVIKDVNRERFAVHFDPVNLVNSPQKAMFYTDLRDNAIKLLAPYIKSCHIKDFDRKLSLTVELFETPPGTGRADIPSYLQRIYEVNPNMTMIIEHLKDWEEYDRAIAYVLDAAKRQSLPVR